MKEKCLIYDRNIQDSLKQTIDINVKAKTIRLLAENVKVKLSDLGLRNGFLDTTKRKRNTRKKTRQTRTPPALKTFVHQRVPSKS